MLTLLLTGGLLLGNLSITVSPATAGPAVSPPAPSVPGLTNPIYIPFMAKNVSDLFISNVEVTQAVQNLLTPISLVAGRPSEVRVYARTTSSSDVGNLNASLVGYKDGVRLGMLTAGPSTAYVQSDSVQILRSSSAESFNFQLPANWTAAGVLTLAANINTNHTASELSDVNTTTLQYTFNSMPALNVMVIPINYVTTVRGMPYTYPPASTSYIQEGLFRMYPVPQVNITVHAPITYQGNLNNDTDWDTLLNQIDSIKQSEGKPASTVYFGEIPLLDSSGGSWFNCQSGGVVGYGFVGYRASIAVTKAVVCNGVFDLHGDDFAAHEIGHNLGMGHTPCNVVSDEPNYPYPNGIIGQYGFYVNAQSVMDMNRPDIMSYCEPEWVSDFTYQRWYDNQKSMLAEVVAPPAQDTLLVRADLASDGTAKLQPVYNFSASPSSLPTSSDYKVQFLDAQGNLVTEYPVAVKRAEEHGHVIQTISDRLPRPSQPYSSVRVVHNGQFLDTRDVSSQTTLAPLAAPTVNVNASDLVLNWASSTSPALVRYTSDSGQTWTTAGVDVTGGEIRLPVADLPTTPLQFQVIPADGTASLTVDWTP